MDSNNKTGLGIELDLIELPDLPELDDEYCEQKDSNIIISSKQNEKETVENISKNVEELSYEGGFLSKIIPDLDEQIKTGKFLRSFTAQIGEVNHIVNMDYATTVDIASVILKDIALSSKVLSIVNSSYYSRLGEKGIASISDAVFILGTNEVQQAATTILLFEFMRDIGKSDMLKEKSLASLMRGLMAKDIAEDRHYKEADQFQIAAMLYDIGEQIILFCDPQTYQRIIRISDQKGIDREIVSKQFIGASFAQIGTEVVSKWGFPKSILDSIQPLESSMDRKLFTIRNMKRIVASFTNDMCNIDWRASPILRKKKIEQIVKRYGYLLNLGISGASQILNNAINKVEKHAKILNVILKNSRFDRNSEKKILDLQIESDQKVWTPSEIETYDMPTEALSAVDKKANQKTEWVENNIREIQKIIDSGFKLSEILHLIITTIYKGFFFSRISICIMNKEKGMMAVRFVLGDDSEKFSKDFQFVVSNGDDTFNKALTTGIDIVVENVSNRALNSKIPDWYIKGNFAESFAIYPLIVEQKKVGLIYVDWESSDTHLFSDEVKQLMQQLKNLTVTAIKKSRT
ncbi:MAG: HDOD domain-containing protein [Desulfamplus sp.]|nr:HDOD domain-containing protein [Desulfamplus sp.]